MELALRNIVAGAPVAASVVFFMTPAIQPILSAVAETVPLSQERLNELIGYANSSKRGSNYQLPEDIVEALGLPRPGPLVRQFGVEEKPGLQRLFHILPGEKGYLLARRDYSAARLYLLDPRLQLVSAAIAPAGGRMQRVRDLDTARKEARQELEA